MRGIIIIIAILLAIPAIGQEITPNNTFEEHPELYKNVFSNKYWKTELLFENYQLMNDIWFRHHKQNVEMVIGGSIFTVGVGTLFFASEYMDIPIHQVGNQAMNDEADRDRRNRIIVGSVGGALTAAGAIIFARAFRHHKWIRAQVGLQSLKLEYNLFGKRSYLQGEKNKKFKTW
jgi:hypothetical protein